MVHSPQRKPLAEAGQSPRVAEISSIKTTAKVLKFDPGLYALSIAETGGPSSEHSGIMLPAFHITNPPSDTLDTVEIVAASGDSTFWVGPEGGTVVIKAPLNGGHVLITTYEPYDQPGTALEVEVRRLDLPTSEMAPTAANETRPEPMVREIKTEILLHIERTGDRRLAANGWVGDRGKKLRIEAFSIRPLEMLAVGDIEYKAFGPNARETPWVSDAKLCGTRGRGLPLTGFAIRLAAHLRDRFDIEYEGAFFESGVSDARRNGEPCTPLIADDPLEALNLRLTERVS
jgi:Clostridial hydrophobic W